MGVAPLTDDQCREVLAALARHDGNTTAAYKALGIARTTFLHRLAIAQMRELGETEPQHLPPADLPFEDRLATMKQRNALRIAHAKAKAWQTVRVPIDGPYGICWFGDPHLDDPYTDLDGFERDATICANTPGLFGANGGDSINNWVGRLERLYADQSATASEGWELVDWALNRLGVKWLLWILGNHDTWNFGKTIFDKMNTRGILMRDWDAKLVLSSPSGTAKVWARHDFKGTSIYNELHGQKRAAMMNEHADIYAAFHRHTWGLAQGELSDGRDFCLLRARGYKMDDDYALKGGFVQQETGQSMVTIVEPQGTNQPIIHAYKDVALAADFLTHRRRKLGF